MRLSPLLCATVAAFSFALSAQAETIHFTESTLASGTFQGNPFYYEVVQLTATADTSNVVQDSATSYHIDASNFTNVVLSVGGTDTSFVGTQPSLYLNTFGDVVAFTLQYGDFLDTTSALLSAYNLQSSFVAFGGEVQNNYTYKTTAGDLQFLSVTGTAEFIATVDAPVETGPVSATPEPGSITLVASGLLGFVGAARRRFRRS